MSPRPSPLLRRILMHVGWLARWRRLPPPPRPAAQMLAIRETPAKQPIGRPDGPPPGHDGEMEEDDEEEEMEEEEEEEEEEEGGTA